MANLYTRTGDGGETSLIGGSRVSKGDIRVECYGTVDEMGAALGFARSISRREYIKDVLYKIQTRLFSLAAELACDEGGGGGGENNLQSQIDQKDIAFLEGVVDKCTETTGFQTQFVVPGETDASGALHFARTVVRRCERVIIRLSRGAPVRESIIKYVNRLSDAVYALARYEETLAEQELLKKRIEEEVKKVLNSMNQNKPLTLENAEEIALRAREKAREINVPIVFAAVDEGGNTLLLQRMEGSFLGSINVALGKAYTANAFKRPTDELGKIVKDPDAELYGLGNEDKIILFGGGYPYYYDQKVVGGIGVSGGSVEEDMLIATYALGDIK